MERRIESLNRRILTVDYGSARIGIAMSDPLRIFAKPFKVLENRGFKALLQELKQLVAIHEVGLVILGMPYAIDGGNTAKTIEIHNLYAKLKHKLGVPVITWDERYSTSDAIAELKMMGLSLEESKKLRDAMAACLILKSYLDGTNQ
ncbi:MAG: Holliday junction resolvase RuvX [Candidatus Cloacimonadaceae bacterium]|nr:Holliday junction resolvase RuvX [Candidatus Cloacimonadaceae bacterium]